MHGRLWRPPIMTVTGGSNLADHCVVDHSHRKGGFNVSCCNVSPVLTSAWFSASSDALAVIFVNHMVHNDSSSTNASDAVVDARLTIPLSRGQRCCATEPALVDLQVDMSRGIATISNRRVVAGGIDTIVLRPLDTLHVKHSLKTDDASPPPTLTTTATTSDDSTTGLWMMSS